MEAERRQVSVLFVDVVDFTAFSERSGDEAAYGLIQVLSKLMEASVRAHGGVVESHTGDGVMAVLVKSVLLLSAAITFGLLRAFVPGATPKKPASGLMACR